MTKKIFITLLSTVLVLPVACGQDYYVDARNGLDINNGSMDLPFQTISKAVRIANELTGTGTIRIRILPGLYTLEDKVSINPVRVLDDTSRFIIEAFVLPDDSLWRTDQMPVIRSVSSNNSTTFFSHATGFLVASAHVTFRGLKFLGNASPDVKYYYPISKEDQTLKSLEVVQCVFVGDKESAKIQGGVWAHGQNNVISHCIFYECRNAVLLFNNVSGFRITNTIVYGAYESAFWFSPDDVEFEFSNNVISNNNNFLVGRSADLKYSSPFSNSIISYNEGFVGYWSRSESKIVGIDKPNIVLEGVSRKTQVEVIENHGVMLEKMHLHVKDPATGTRLNAGIFSKGPL